MRKRRTPWLAAALSSIYPGVGQLYNGQIKKSALFALLGALGALGLTFLASQSFGGLLLALGIGLAIFAATMIEAYLAARKIGEMELQGFQRPYAYLGMVILGSVLSFAIQGGARTELHPIGNLSMAPGIIPGDYVMVSDSAYRSAPVSRGDVILFTNPKDNESFCLKRVVAIPGDMIAIKAGRVLLNGQALPQTPLPAHRAEPFVSLMLDSIGPGESGTLASNFFEETGGSHYWVGYAHGNSSGSDLPPMMVPEGHYFALGDFRDGSTDSRHWGVIPKESIRGRAQYILFSFSELNPLDRLQRIGLSLTGNVR